MLGSCDPIAFVATANAARARVFYEDVLGLRLLADEPFALVFDLHGTMLRVTRVERVEAAPYTVLGWRVRGIRRIVEALRARGVSFRRHDGLAQDALGVWTSPGGAQIAWFEDPDGNTLSLTEWPEG